MSELLQPEGAVAEPGVAETGAPGARSGGAGRTGGRWGLALGALAVAIGVIAAGAILVSSPSQPEALRYVPSGAAVLLELRPDLPGDQGQALAGLLGRYPGFADQAAIPQKIDAALDRLVVQATNGKRHYIGDLKPYAAGPLYAVLLGDAGAAGSELGLAILTTDGSVGCQGLEEGSAVTIERYRDTDVRIRAATPRPSVLPSASPSAAAPGASGSRDATGSSAPSACATSGTIVLVGDPASVRAALDARATGQNVTGDQGYASAARALTGDHAVWAYVDGQKVAALASAAPRPSGVVALTSLAPLPTGLTPDWVAADVRLTTGSIVVEGAMPDQRAAMLALGASPGAAITLAPDAVSAIAPALPASTVAVVEVHQAGAFLSAILRQQATTVVPGLTPGARSSSSPASPGGSSTPSIGESPGASGSLAQLESALALLGGTDSLFGKVDQAALVLTRDGSTPGGGVVLRTDDASSAKSRLEQLRSLLALFGAAEQTYHGDPIVTIPLGTLLRLSPAGQPSVGGTPPSTTGPTLGSATTVSIGVHGDLVAAGPGDAFVKAVIDTTAGSSLADQTAYKSAIAAAGNPSQAQGYLDLPDLLALLEPRLPASERTAFDRDVLPWLKPVSTVAMAATGSGGVVHSQVVFTIP